MSLEDSPMNPFKNHNLDAVMGRYEKANLMTIVTSSRIVFESLADIPRLVARIRELEKALTKQTESNNIVGGLEIDNVKDMGSRSNGESSE